LCDMVRAMGLLKASDHGDQAMDHTQQTYHDNFNP